MREPVHRMSHSPVRRWAAALPLALLLLSSITWPAPAWAQADAAAVPAGHIVGTVDVPSYAPGTPYVGAARSMTDLGRGQVVALTRVNPDGSFHLDGLSPDSYWVAAFLDANDNRYPDRRTEAYVLWPKAIEVPAGGTVTGITLHNFLNLADPTVKTPERNAQVDQWFREAEQALQGLIDDPPPASAHPDRLLPTLRVRVFEARRFWERPESEANWAFVRDTLTAIPAAAAAARRGQDPIAGQTGWQLLGFVRAMDRAVQPYLLYVPPDSDPSAPTPLVVALHGGGGNHWSGARMVVGAEGIEAYGPAHVHRIWPAAPNAKMLVAAPADQPGGAWRYFGEANVLHVLDQVERHYRVDPNRVYLTGYSDGGRGAWEIGVRHPDRFAAILVGAGATEMAQFFAMNLAHVRMRIVHGTRDRSIPVSNARRMAVLGSQFDAPWQYVEVDRGHDAADICYGDGRAFAWFAQFVRNPYPPYVRYRTEHMLYNHGPGLTITQQIDPKRHMDVAVHWIDATHVEIRTTNIAGLILQVAPGDGTSIHVTWNDVARTFDGRPEGLALQAELNAQGELTFSMTPAAAPEAPPLGPYGPRG